MTTDIVTQQLTGEIAEFAEAGSALEGLYIQAVGLPIVDPEQATTFALYQWQAYQQGSWSAQQQGSVEQLMVLPLPANIIFVIPANAVVTRTVAVGDGERRLFKKLVPFQLEEDIIDDVEDLHFVFSELHGNSVDLAYIDRNLLHAWLAPLNEKNISVNYALSHASLLPCTGQWCFSLLGEQLEYRFNRSNYGAVAQSLLPMFFKSLVAKREKPPAIELLAASPELLAQLEKSLPEALQALVQTRRILNEEIPAQRSTLVNLAVDQFFPRIALDRWWAFCRLPLMLLSIGLGVHLLVALAQWQIASSRTEAVKTAITERYRSAVPVGAISDPLKQLRNQVGKLGSSGNASNALFVLAHAVPVLTSIQGVEVKNLQFINDAQELRLTIQAPALADIDMLSASFKAKGFGAEVLSVNVNQGVHQARMRVTRK